MFAVAHPSRVSKKFSYHMLLGGGANTARMIPTSDDVRMTMRNNPESLSLPAMHLLIRWLSMDGRDL